MSHCPPVRPSARPSLRPTVNPSVRPSVRLPSEGEYSSSRQAQTIFPDWPSDRKGYGEWRNQARLDSPSAAMVPRGGRVEIAWSINSIRTIGLQHYVLTNIFSSNRSVSPEAGPRAEGLETVFLYIMPITSIYHFTFMYPQISLM